MRQAARASTRCFRLCKQTLAPVPRRGELDLWLRRGGHRPPICVPSASRCVCWRPPAPLAQRARLLSGEWSTRDQSSSPDTGAWRTRSPISAVMQPPPQWSGGQQAPHGWGSTQQQQQQQQQQQVRRRAEAHQGRPCGRSRSACRVSLGAPDAIGRTRDTQGYHGRSHGAWHWEKRVWAAATRRAPKSTLFRCALCHGAAPRLW